MNANNILLQMKYTRIVAEFAKQLSMPLAQALDFFYHSMTYQEMREGIADMHCRSDLYLVDELKLELNQQTDNQVYKIKQNQ